MTIKRKFIPVAIMTIALSGCAESKNKNIPVTGVDIREETISMLIGETKTLNAIVNPEDATDKTVSWLSSNTSVASVDSKTGLINSISEGTSTITVKTNDGGFTDTCVVTVTKPVVPQTMIPVTFINNDSDKVTVKTDKKEAELNETITVTITSVKDGYDLESYTLKHNDGSNIATTKVDETKFTYKQTEDGIVNFDAKIVGKDIPAYVTDDQELISYVSIVGSDKAIEKKTSETIGRDFYTFTYGETVEFYLKGKGYIEPTGIEIDGEFTAIKDDKVVFTATLDDTSDFFFDIVVKYKDNTPKIGEYDLDIQNTAHLTIEAYNADKSMKINSANQNDIVMIKVTPVNEDYGVREVSVTSTNSDLGSLVKTNVSDLGDGWYSFKTPYAHNKVIHIAVTESNATVLKGHEIVGDYFCIWDSGAATKFSSFSDNYNLNICADGTMTCNYGNRTAVLASASDGVIATDSSYPTYFAYGNNVVLVGVKPGAPSGTFSAPALDDNMIAIKKENPGDTADLYSVYGEKFVINEQKYIVIEVYKETKLYATAYLELDAKNYKFGVEFNHLTGAHINDDIALYEVKDNDNIIKVVGSDGNGTYASRCFMSTYYGTFINGENTLNIYGVLKAEYNGELYSYTFDENKISLSSSTRNITLELDADNRTFTIENDEVITLNLPEFAGKKYRSNFCFENDWTSFGMYLEFSSTDMTLSCAVAATYNLDMTNNGTQRTIVNFDVEYTYDETTKVVTVTLTNTRNQMKTVHLTYTGSAFKVKAKEIDSTWFDQTATIQEMK